MKKLVLALVAVATMVACASPAHARKAHHRHGHHASHHRAHRLPWCGIYMSNYFGIHKRSLWLARNWAHEGVPVSSPGVGAVVVWPHHVGVIVGEPDAHGRWLVHSGNDGNAVRTRARSLRGAIAFRYIGYAAVQGVYAGASETRNIFEQPRTRRGYKHLHALAAESRHRGVVVTLQQPLAEANGAEFPSTFSFASPITPETYAAHVPLRHHAKAKFKR